MRNRGAFLAALGALCLLSALAGCGSSADTKTYVMPSESMAPTYEPEEEVTVDLDAYDGADPEVGDAVVFHPPAGVEGGVQCGVRPRRGEPCPAPTRAMSDQLFLKRIVAGPGDTLSIEDGHPVVNGKIQRNEPSTVPCGQFGACNMPRTITILPDHYFMLGDNRPASDDSRFWGPVPSAWIQGRAED